MRRMRWVLMLAAPLLAAGCTASPVPVSGTVTLDGKPLAGAVVTFLPAAQESQFGASSGVTDAAGHYVLTTVDKPRSGVGSGTHKVSVSMRKKTSPPRPATGHGVKAGKGDEPSTVMVAEESEQEILPARYNLRTELTFDVPPGGSDKADFALTTKK